MLWNMNMQCDQVTETRRLHIVFIDKEVKTTDVAVPEDVRVNRGRSQDFLRPGKVSLN